MKLVRYSTCVFLGAIFFVGFGCQNQHLSAKTEETKNATEGASEPTKAKTTKPVLINATTLPQLDGDSLELFGASRPKVTVLALWATWCEPCLQELPFLEKLYQKYQDDPDVIIATINVDEKEEIETVKEAVKKLKLSLPVLLEDGGFAQKNFGSFLGFTLPVLYIIDQQFYRYKETGWAGGTIEEYMKHKSKIIEQARLKTLKK